jgi:RimJ/RimL family protein N-acetyltransferase
MRRILETRRLVLETFAPSEWTLFMELDSDPEVMRFLTGGRPSTEAETQAAMQRTQLLEQKHPGRFGVWKALDKQTGEYLGWFIFRPDKKDPDNLKDIELGYRLKRRFWGQGLATEGSEALLQRGFSDPEIRSIWAKTLLANLGSQGVMKKLGMKLTEEFWEEEFEGEDKNAVKYAITREEWLARARS